MTIDELKDYSKDDLIAELINRSTFVGLVVFCRGDAKNGQIEPGEIVMTKSPPLTRQGVETLLQVGESLVPGMFGDDDDVFQDSVPLRKEDSGAIRIGETRVLLELVIREFEDGATPETIVQQYDTLTLADVYAVIAYYLRHRERIERYMQDREKKAVEVQKRIESLQPDLSEIRNRLTAHRRT